MTWITDSTGTRWVEPEPRKRRRPGRALRFANLQAGDVLLHLENGAWMPGEHAPKLAPTLLNSFAIVTHRWFDPVAGEHDPVSGEMAAIRHVTSRGEMARLDRRTLRGLATQGYHMATPEQAEALRAWTANRSEVTALYRNGKITAKEAVLRSQSWKSMLRQAGLA